jgi:hypothetical protein
MMFWMKFWLGVAEGLFGRPKAEPGLEIVYRRGNVTFVRRPEPHRSSA